MAYEKEIELGFCFRFNELNLKFKTSKKLYDIRAVVPVKRQVPFDVSIDIGNSILAIIEFKSPRFIDVFDYSRIEKYASENNIRFFVLSDGEKFIVTDRRKKESSRRKYSFEKFIELIQQREIINQGNLKQQIADRIKEIVVGSNFKFLKEEIDSFYSHLISEIDYNEIEQSFSFKNPTDISNIENKIFRLLLKEDKPLKTIYRYTTLSTIFSMLSYNSFRMNCLVGMNDTTEVNYAENYIFGTNRDYTQAPWQTVDAYNRRFISSCSLKQDDLTQWRLYSDDSKGVCLIFNINQEQLNSKFIIKRISYGTPDGRHLELDLIKDIIARLKDEMNIDFEFKTLNTWRHFFKPHDYSVEEEVRLLYIHSIDEEIKKGWLLTASHNILNPFVEFPLNDNSHPFQLAEIVLGPKCPEKGINQKQFEQLIRELRRRKKYATVGEVRTKVDEYNLTKVSVSISKIKNYR